MKSKKKKYTTDEGKTAEEEEEEEEEDEDEEGQNPRTEQRKQCKHCVWFPNITTDLSMIGITKYL